MLYGILLFSHSSLKNEFNNIFLSFGTIENIYDDILDNLDFSQKMSLSYCNKSLPDWYNLRSDKGFFGSSIECRLPFQDPKLIEFLIAALNEIDMLTADVGNAYLNAKPREKVYFIAGSEFGSQSGKKVVIVCDLYGLKSSASAWRDNMCSTLQEYSVFSYRSP